MTDEAATTDATKLADALDRELMGSTLAEQPAVPLYHYTDAAGFHGMISSRQIWATHFRHLNDRTELLAGEALINDEADRVLAQLSRTSVRVGYAIETFRRIHTGRSLSQIGEVFVASFSEIGDQLSQWRGYAATGSGYSLEIRKLRLPTEDRADAALALILMRCTYSEVDFRAIVRAELLRIAERFDAYAEQHATDGEMLTEFASVAVSVLLRRIALFVPKFKHPSFAEEREWRLVAIPMRGREKELVCFRPARSSVTPYIPIDLADEGEPIGLHRVLVGPATDPITGEHGARLLLKHHGYDGVVVERSSIPFRG